MTDNNKASVLKIVGVVALYWFISISMVFANKQLLGGQNTRTDLSIFIAWIQCIVTTFIGLIVQFVRKKISTSSHDTPIFNVKNMAKYQVISLNISYVAMLVFNNLCLKHVDISFYQLARSLTLAFTVLLAVMILKQSVTWRSILCCLVVIAGFVLGVDQEQVAGTLSLKGILFGITTSVFVALNGVLTKRALAVVESDSVKLTLYNNMNAIILMAPFVLITGQLSSVFRLGLLTDYNFLILLAGSSVLGFLIGWISAVQINVTSPISHHVSANAKAVLQTIIAVFWLREHKSVWWWCSVLMVVGGAIGYAAVKAAESRGTVERIVAQASLKSTPANVISYETLYSRDKDVEARA